MKKNQNRGQKTTRPFEGMIRQMRQESLILVALPKVKPFIQECAKRHISVGVGDVHNGGIIIYQK